MLSMHKKPNELSSTREIVWEEHLHCGKLSRRIDIDDVVIIDV